MPTRLLVIGNKRYSSWSLRAWIGLKQLGLPFQERRISLYAPGYKEQLAPLSPSGKVPVLTDDGVTVHDSLAILEYLNETYAQGAWLPKAPKARALARSVSAEMHAGFQNMRQHLNMNLGRAPKPTTPDEAARADVNRVLAIWEGCRREHEGEGPWLFGAWGIADAMYLPVAARFHHWAVDLSAHPRAQAYGKALYALPAFQEWKADALKETDLLPQFEK